MVTSSRIGRPVVITGTLTALPSGFGKTPGHGRPGVSHEDSRITPFTQ